ncbi:MAG: molybdenum cofactor biosynthesis protein MoaE [Verrucomicrobia bacterium]|nr:MAG: molybdenum cofactor biosynthesis protein MoaE [Verrucomicrobiota bacterium]
MSFLIHLGPEPIPAILPSPDTGPGVGALAEFRGLVRGEENGRPIGGLRYEAYRPMAERQITRILEELTAAQPVLAVRVIHRLGAVPVGVAAIYIGVAARHRAEAFAVLVAFMDRLKQDVPIWKTHTLPPGEKSVLPD